MRHEITDLMREQAKGFGLNIDEFFAENPERDDWGFCEECDEYYFGFEFCPCGGKDNKYEHELKKEKLRTDKKKLKRGIEQLRGRLKREISLNESEISASYKVKDIYIIREKSGKPGYLNSRVYFMEDGKIFKESYSDGIFCSLFEVAYASAEYAAISIRLR